MNNRIDLESAIMTVWQTVDDLKLFAEMYYDGPKEMTLDETMGHIEGIRGILEMRMERLQDAYERKMELNQYCVDPEKLAARARARLFNNEEGSDD
jgi:hypothetical protein